jgi:ribonuclease T2
MAWVARIKDAPVPQQSSSSSVLESVSDNTMPSLRSLSKYAISAFGASQSVLAGTMNMNMRSLAVDSFSSCPSPELSCHNTTAQANLCCFNSPGGALLQTQFWDTSPPTGPDDSWTVHGLWPDNCDGTYEANCDPKRAYTNITEILQAAGADETLSYMQKYWKDYQGNDESFWEHEWSKHGTCISTLDPSCYPDYQPTQEVPIFFNRTVSLFQSLPSYSFLSDAGIVPSTSQTYTSADIQAALSKNHDGMEVYLGCSSGALNEIWYFFNVRGTLQDGTFEPSAPLAKSKCPATGVKYLPKGASNPAPTGTATRTTSGSAPTSTSGPFSGKGNLNVQVSGASKGCLISSGKWYVSGTCATYTAEAASGNAPRAADDAASFTLKSSKGDCGLVDGAFACGSGVTKGVFGADGGQLLFDGSANFTADGVPSGTEQVSVYADDSHTVVLDLQWQGA